MISSNRSIKVVKELLKRGTITQKDLSQYSGVSIGLVNKVVRRLRDSFLLVQDSRGVSLRDHIRLLTFFSVEKPMSRRLLKNYVSHVSYDETLKIISKKLKNFNYAFTLLTALPRYSAAATGDTISLYIDKNQIDLADEILKSLNFSEKGNGPIVEIYEGYEGILYDTKTIDGVNYVSQEQLLIDFFSTTQYNYVAVQLLEEYLEVMKPCNLCGGDKKVMCDCINVKKIGFGYNLIKSDNGHTILAINNIGGESKSIKRKISLELSVFLIYNPKLKPELQLSEKRKVGGISIGMGLWNIEEKELDAFKIDFGNCSEIEKTLGKELEPSDFNTEINVVDIKPLLDCQECNGKGYVMCPKCGTI